MLKSNSLRTRSLATIAVAGLCLLPMASFAQRGGGHAFVRGGFHGGYAGGWHGGGARIGIGLGVGIAPVYGPSVVVGGYPGYYADPYYPVVPGPYVAPYVSGGLWIGGGHGGYVRGGYVHGGGHFGGFHGRR